MSTEPPPAESDEDTTYLEVLKYRSTAHYLEDLSRRILLEFFAPDFRNSSLISKHVHKDFTWNDAGGSTPGHSPLPHIRGRQDHFKVWEMLQQENPTYAVEPLNYTAMVHRGTRTVEVYYPVLEKLLSNGKLLTRENCAVSFWEGQPADGVWVLYRYILVQVQPILTADAD